MEQGAAISVEAVERLLAVQQTIADNPSDPQNTDVVVAEIDLGLYDKLLAASQLSLEQLKLNTGELPTVGLNTEEGD